MSSKYFDEADEEDDDDGSTTGSSVQQTEVPSTGKPSRSSGGREDLFEKDNPTNGVEDRYWMVVTIGIICLLNVLIIGIEAEFGCFECPEKWLLWVLSDIFFTVAFLIEMVARIVLSGPRGFFLGVQPFEETRFTFQGLFNILDLGLVLCRFVDMIINIAGVGFPLKMVTMIRIHKLRFIVTKMQVSGNFQETGLIISGTLENIFKSVTWVSAALLVVMWSFAVILVTYVGQDPDNDEYTYEITPGASATRQWGTMMSAMLTLLQMITLDSWWTGVCWPLIRESPGLSIILLVFVIIGVLGFMSLIVANIVQNTLLISMEISEERAKDLRAVKQSLLESLQQVVEEADTNFDGYLDREELKVCLAQPHVRARLTLLQLQPRDLEDLFRLLDMNSGYTGAVDNKRFFTSCGSLYGQASAMDLNRLEVDIIRSIGTSNKNVDRITGINKELKGVLDLCRSIDSEVVRCPDDLGDPVVVLRQQRRAREVEMQIQEQRKGKKNKRASGRRPSAGGSVRAETKTTARGALLTAALGLGKDLRSATKASLDTKKEETRKATLQSLGLDNSQPPSTSQQKQNKNASRQTFMWSI